MSGMVLDLGRLRFLLATGVAVDVYFSRVRALAVSVIAVVGGGDPWVDGLGCDDGSCEGAGKYSHS